MAAPVDAAFSIAVIPPVNDSSVGYAWADRSTTNSYSPNATYAHNPEGSAIQATRRGTGRYTVNFEDLNQANQAGGHVHVTAYGAAANHCKVESWDNAGLDFSANVACFNSSGSRVDSQFNVLAVPSPEGDRFEPNDTRGSATDLGTGEQTIEDLSVLGCGTGVTNCSIPDFYRWSGDFVGGSGEVEVTAQFRNADGNLDLEVINGSGRAFRSATNNDNETVRLNVRSGEDIIIKVEGRNGATNEDYSLTFIPDDHGNDASSASPALRDPRDESYFVGEIQSPTDVDWFQFEAARGKEVTFESFWLRLSSSAGSDLAVINLYDRDGVTLLGSSSATASLDFQRGPGMDWVVPRDGVYFLEVKSGSLYQYDVRVDGIEQPNNSGVELNLTATFASSGFLSRQRNYSIRHTGTPSILC